MDRQAANRALSKAIAYVECGKPELAAEWLTTLTEMFSFEGVVPVIEPQTTQVQHDLSAASAWLGGALLKRDGRVQL
jgi:hypothetical protein